MFVLDRAIHSGLAQLRRPAPLLAALLVLTAASAHAQLELPAKPKAGSGAGQEQSSGEEPAAESRKRNPAQRLLELGQPPAPREATMSRRTINVGSNSNRHSQQGNGSGLDLPSSPRRETADRREQRGAASDAPQAEAKPARSDSGAGASPASDERFSGDSSFGSAVLVYDEVRKLRKVDDPLARRAVDTLLSLGERGLEASRIAIAEQENAAVVIVAARVLLRSGVREDAEQVVKRLDMHIPSMAAVPLVESLVELDPVRATPALLGRLLDHPTAAVRQAAARSLGGALTSDDLNVLRPALNSDRKDSRLLAIDLMADMRDAATFDWLIECIDDPVAKVARRALDAVVRLDDPRTIDTLRELAFGKRWLLRTESYALLGLIQIEDREFKAILDESHIDVLSRGLSGNDPFVSGCCAAALAGIGFRSRDLERTKWLDHAVPQVLVAIVSGEHFFSDFSSMQSPAQRRLTQIAGVSYGADGPKWATWWLTSGESFRASRAVLQVAEGAESRLKVLYSSTEQAPGVFQLVGSACRRDQLSAEDGESFYLTDTEAYDLIEVLRREGLFDAQRLPGPRGGEIARGRRLELRIDNQAKSFLFGRGVAEDWFERSVAAVQAVEARNLWQRFSDSKKYKSRRDFWIDESGYWSGLHDEYERDQRMKELVFTHALAQTADERSPSIEALERLYAKPQNRDPDDLAGILAMLEGEGFFGDHARSLARLGRQCLGLDVPSLESRSEDDLPVLFGDRLLARLSEHFGSAAGEEIAATLAGMGPAAVRARATSELGLMRGLCAELLGEYGGPEDVAALIELMRDRDPDVVATAALVAGSHKHEEALGPMTVLATSAGPSVRAAALRGLGMLGGEGAQSILLDGLSEADQDLRRAAAEGLASLEDPSLAPLFVSLMRKGPRNSTTDAARDGLRKLGEVAFPDLMRALRSPSPELQREAAVLLSEQLQPDAAAVLMRVLSEDPTDSLVARELAILTCVDKRGSGDPAAEWWIWWDSVKHNDALAWFRAATDRLGLAAPAPEEFDGRGSSDAQDFLIDCMRLEEPYLVIRARRQLERMLGRKLGEPPAAGAERNLWLETLHESVRASRN